MLKRLIASALLLSVGCVAARAMPIVSAARGDTSIVLVAGGCGLAFHRDPYGVCVANRRAFYAPGPYAAPLVRLPPPCPRGYHRDPDPARRLCYPNL